MPREAKTIALIFIIFWIIVTPLSLVKANDFSIVINEICWMGDANKTSNEWIELYNNTNNLISLESWVLKIDETEIKLKTTILPQGFYLISRNKNMNADLIFSKALKNTGNKLVLYDNNKNIIDEINWAKGWPAGDNKTKQTMEKINPLLSGNLKNNWQTSENSNGTPKQKNSNGAIKNNENSNNEIGPEDIILIQNNNLNPSNSQIQNFPKSKAIFLAILLSLSSGGIMFWLKKSIKNDK